MVERGTPSGRPLLTGPPEASAEASAEVSPEAALFWAAASPWPDPDLVGSMVGGADLGVLAAAAERHRVGPLVLASLAAAGLDTAAAPELARLRAEAGLRSGQERILVPRALELAITPLVEAGMRPTVIKGPALVERYPRPGLRGMDDIDLLLDRRDHLAAHRLLDQAGWRRAGHTGGSADVPFVHPDLPGLPLELHHQLEVWKYRTSQLRVHELVQESQRRPVLGVDAYVLPPEIELLVLAVHAAKPWHVYNRLIWAVDLVVVSRAAPLDWATVLERSETLGCRTALAVGARLGARLGAEIPSEVQVLRGRAARAGLLDPLLDPELPVRPPDRRGLLGVALADGARARARLVAGMVAAGRDGRLRQAARVGRAGVRWGWRLVRARAS